MRIKINYNAALSLVLFFPIVLGVVFAFNIPPQFLMPPYFFIVFMSLFILLALRGTLILSGEFFKDKAIILFLFFISVLNFNGVRYSMPIFFLAYITMFLFFLSGLNGKDRCICKKTLQVFMLLYLVMSFVFLIFFDFSFLQVGNRFKGFTSSPTTYSAIMAVLFVLLDSYNLKWGLKRMLFFGIVFLLIYLTKTRMLLIFIVIYPLLRYFLDKLNYSRRFIYLIVFGVLFFTYPLYGAVVEFYPELISFRYQDGRDASFGLRYHLFELVNSEFNRGSIFEMLFGQGNEKARMLVLDDIGADFLPHNDFIRIVLDWGIIGALSYFYLIYRLAIRNKLSTIIAILYLILFYSNMVFNLFLVSILLLTSFQINSVVSGKSF